MFTVDDAQPTTSVGDAPARDGDARATAVLAVLGGVPADQVASRYGVNPGVLDRWVRTFVQAGRQGLAAGAPGEESTSHHRDRYLGLVAHELRSPLAMIRGWTDLVGDDDHEVRAMAIAGINAQVARLTRLAEDALDATSVALGRLELSTAPTSLAGAVRRTVEARSVDAPEVQVEEDVVVRLDDHRFGQIVDNLLENVRKHTAGAAGIVVRRHGLFGEVVVSSAGEPIRPEIARRMFEPFERGSTGGEGVGLGLYVCRSLIVAHGGQIGLRVDEDGNHFWLRVPVDRGDELR